MKQRGTIPEYNIVTPGSPDRCSWRCCIINYSLRLSAARRSRFSKLLQHGGLGEAHQVGAVAGLGVLEKDAVGIEYLAADHEDKGVL